MIDRIKAQNHACLFAYLCKNHEELDLDFGFFETVRTKRNAINYYGESISYGYWKSVELQMKLYISILTKEIKERIKE